MTAKTMLGRKVGFSAMRRALRRIGVAGFTFFLVKGLLWLVVPYAIWALHG